MSGICQLQTEVGLTAVQRLLKERQRIKAVNKIGGISGGILELGF